MPPPTLFVYIFRRALVSIGLLFLALAALVSLIDLIESLRFAEKLEGAGLAFAAHLTLLRALSLSQALFPFVFLFGSIWLFHQLNRRSEIAVMRSAGLSVWRVIAPAALVASIVGFGSMTALDPLAARLLIAGESLKNDVRGKPQSFMKLHGDGIWLRQREGDSLLLINAASFDPAAGMLRSVRLWRLGDDGAFRERIDAEDATFGVRALNLRQAITTGPNAIAPRSPVYIVPTSLSPEDLKGGAPAPEMMSLWDLPNFIRLAETAGLPSERYTMRFHDLCATPLKFVAMVLIAAMFSLRPVRSGGAFRLVLMSVGVGFALYILSSLARALGESGVAPIALAAWTPALIATLIALTRLLAVEEG